MNILITGVHGFVGSNLVAALKEQHMIYGLDIVSLPKEGVVKTFEWKELGQIPSVDVIIHLAGKAHDTKKQSGSQVYFEINVGLTQIIYNYFLASGAKKFIFFSSVKAVADSVHEGVLTEDVVPNPQGPYGESKQAAEQYILSKFQTYCSELRTQNSELKKVYILRPCMIHGPGNKGNLNLLYKMVQKGIPWPLGTFENQRSFTSIDNLCFVIECLISVNIVSGIYNMADDEALSTNELVELIAEMKGRKTKIWQLPRGMIRILAGLGGYLHLPLNPERLNKLTENYVVSNEKIKKALGIINMPVRARDGIVITLNSFEN